MSQHLGNCFFKSKPYNLFLLKPYQLKIDKVIQRLSIQNTKLGHTRDRLLQASCRPRPFGQLTQSTQSGRTAS
jgi:hypothetical protein